MVAKKKKKVVETIGWISDELVHKLNKQLGGEGILIVSVRKDTGTAINSHFESPMARMNVLNAAAEMLNDDPMGKMVQMMTHLAKLAED